MNPQRYEQMGVREYFLFDPNEFVKPRLQAWHFSDGKSLRSEAVEVADGTVGIYSHVLGLHLCHTDPWGVDAKATIKLGRLQWHDPATGKFLVTMSELMQHTAETKRTEEAVQSADAKVQGRRALEARVAALEAQLRRQ